MAKEIYEFKTDVDAPLLLLKQYKILGIEFSEGEITIVNRAVQKDRMRMLEYSEDGKAAMEKLGNLYKEEIQRALDLGKRKKKANMVVIK